MRKKFYCDVTIIGAWNKSIINPIWLKEQFPSLFKDSDIKSELKIGSSLTFRHTIDNVSIEVMDDRILFITEFEQKKNLKFIADLSLFICEKLPHTPILAIGHNFIYTPRNTLKGIEKLLNNEQQEQLIQKFNSGYHIENQFHFSFAEHKKILKIILINNKKERYINVSFNYHYLIQSNEDIRNALNEFIKNYHDSKQKLINLENNK